MTEEILVFGSMNADLVFPVACLPTPGETVICGSHAIYPGGKGANQAVAAARAGMRVRMAGCLGRDGFGDFLNASLVAAGVDTSLVRLSAAPTGCAAIGVDRKGANQIMVAGGANLVAHAEDVPDARLTPETTLLLQMEVTPAENWALIHRARRRGARVILNIAPAARVPPEVLGEIDVLAVNEIEAVAVAHGLGEAIDDPLDAARALARHAGLACVVTLGARGAAAFAAEGGWRVPALAVKPVDTTGAGDCFVGWLAARFAAGEALAEATRWASTAAGLSCLTRGAQPSLPDHETVAAHLEAVAAAETI